MIRFKSISQTLNPQFQAPRNTALNNIEKNEKIIKRSTNYAKNQQFLDLFAITAKGMKKERKNIKHEIAKKRKK